MIKHLAIWLKTARPKTLPLALASIMTGSALAYWSAHFNLWITFLCFVTTILLQILSNFANDYGDHQKGSDTAERIGPLRAIQQGEINAQQLKKGLIVVALLSLCSGGLLILSAYQTLTDLFVFALLGVLSIIAAITYTVGQKPYGYMGLGDLSVLIFFGVLGVCGTYYLQVNTFHWLILLPAVAAGLLASAVLNINNLRDIEQDRQVGKFTLAVRLGTAKARLYHLLLLILAVICLLAFNIMAQLSYSAYLFMLALPLLYKHAHFVYYHQHPAELRPMLAQMSMLALLTNGLFSLGLLINA